jgi:hypothetical protein
MSPLYDFGHVIIRSDYGGKGLSLLVPAEAVYM